MQTAWVSTTVFKLILAAMLPENRLAVEVSEATGLRIDDVLSLKTEQIAKSNRPTVQDSKTGKRHRIYVPVELQRRMLQQAGVVWVWPHRLEPLAKHRTRQAVYKDMVQAAAVFKRAQHLEGVVGAVSPHSARKRAAVRAYEQGGLDAAKRLLQHSDASTTLLYALSDIAPKRRKRKKRTP